jgi:hypothetical protein
LTPSLGLGVHSARTYIVYRAHRGQSRIKARLIGDCDPASWDLPPKPKWMRWSTYSRLEDRFDRYEDVLDAYTISLLARLEVFEPKSG